MQERKKYSHSRKIQYKGVLYDSLLELRFVLIIENKCSWIREPKSIFYNPITLMPTNYIQENTKKYTPDFLVRKWCDNSAHLIELKPEKFKESEQVQIRQKVVANYLNQNNLDWKFTVLTEKDLILNEKQKEKYKSILDNNKYFNQKLSLIKRDRKFNKTSQKYFSSIPQINSTEISEKDYIRYVKYGKLPL